jgi:hypothetical protein
VHCACTSRLSLVGLRQSTSCKVLCVRGLFSSAVKNATFGRFTFKLVDLVTRLLTRYKENRLGQRLCHGASLVQIDSLEHSDDEEDNATSHLT